MKLSKYTYMWDEASLEVLGAEKHMHRLLEVQPITKADGSSPADYLIFDGGLDIHIPVEPNEVDYFKAPWDE